MGAPRSIWLDPASRFTLQAQLTQQLREQIQQGLLRPGDALPSSRELAATVRVSRNTVVYAYDRLMSEGYIETEARSGVFVSRSIPLGALRGKPLNAHARKRNLASTPIPDLRTPLPFRPCQPDVNLFPLLMWNRLRGRALRTEGRNLLHYQAICSMGLPALRERLAAYLLENRGVRCDWRQIAITTGSQQGLMLLAALLLGPGKRAYMEDPGYLGARLAWQEAGAAIDTARIDDQGLVLPARDQQCSIIYTTPSRQFPTGVCLSLARRMELLEFAGRTKSWVAEDDYDSEFRFTAPPLPSLQSLDRFGRVIYVGTFSKVLFPSLRLGYVVLPESLVAEFGRLKALMDDHGPLIDQATLALFLESGAFHSHIRRCRRAYGERQEVFLEHARKCGLPLDFPCTDGGMNLTGLFPDKKTDDRKWSHRFAKAGLDVPALSSYALKHSVSGLVFGFTAFEPKAIRTALETVASLLTGKPAGIAP